ncbi:MAG: alpha/beta hydrolase [Tissierellia bacterium]|nr:alpha/beta hydrolase [Tissierellia bacterium]
MKFNKMFNDSLYVLGYKPENPKAIVQIQHGIVEHIDRYDDLMGFLAANDLYAFGADCRGHGKSAGSIEKLGLGYGEASPDDLLADIKALKDDAKKDFPNIPYFHIGHSMGSFQVRAFLADYPDDIAGAILIGTGENSLSLMNLALWLAKIIKSFKGEGHKSKLLKFLALDSFNSSIKNPKTPLDWLSYNEANVQEYIDDPYCGFGLTVKGYETLFGLIREIADPSIYNEVPKTIPILLLAGGEDPVGKNGKDILKLVDLYKKNGIENVSYKVYPKMRHEILNEDKKLEVYEDILNFISHIINAS